MPIGKWAKQDWAKEGVVLWCNCSRSLSWSHQDLRAGSTLQCQLQWRQGGWPLYPLNDQSLPSHGMWTAPALEDITLEEAAPNSQGQQSWLSWNSHPVGFSTYWFNPEPHISFIFTLRLLNKCLSLTFQGLSVGPHSTSFSFCQWFNPDLCSLLFLLSSFSQYLLFLSPNSFLFLPYEMLLIIPTYWNIPTTRSNFLSVYFLWNHLSFMEAGLFINLWWSSSWFG